jgi:hypothetical protein
LPSRKEYPTPTARCSGPCAKSPIFRDATPRREANHPPRSWLTGYRAGSAHVPAASSQHQATECRRRLLFDQHRAVGERVPRDPSAGLVHSHAVLPRRPCVAHIRFKTVIYVLDEAPVPSVLLPVFLGRFELSEVSSEQQTTSSKKQAVPNFSYRSVTIDGKGAVDVHASFSLIFVCDSERTLDLHPRLSSCTIPIMFRRDCTSDCQALISHVMANVAPSLESQQADVL